MGADLDRLLDLPEDQRKALLSGLTIEEAAKLLYDWELWAREAQVPPDGDWIVWLVMAGRGFGKTRVGAEWVRREVESGRRGRIAVVAEDAADARDVMVEGESGILSVCPPWNRPLYEPSKRRITWPNGAIATTYGAHDPEQLRGPQHDGAWADEIAKWRYPEAWDHLMFGLRLGKQPQAVATTTPKPLRWIKALVADPTTVVTRGSTYENLANLAPAFVHAIITKYKGTRLGRQELLAEILEDAPGALWKRSLIEDGRRTKDAVPTLTRVVVGVDPAVTNTDESSETGIVVAGLGADGHGYVLSDASLRASPHGWASVAIREYYAHRGDRVVGEVNNGGDMVESTIRMVDSAVSYRAVRASRGKAIRAEPVAALYERGIVHHVGAFPELEDQMCLWEPGDEPSPDHMDALVWALTELIVEPEEREVLVEYEERVDISPL